MQMKFRFIYALILLTSCEGIVEGSGYVLDAETKEPLKEVSVRAYSKHGKRKNFQGETKTDSTGHFTSSTGLVGCSNDCPDLFVEILKSGYKTSEWTNPNEDTIYLMK